MQFDLEKSKEILRRTPDVLEALLAGLSDEWIMNNEGPDTFSPFDVVGHLVYGEKTDWIVRAQILLSAGVDEALEQFDPYAMYETSKGKLMSDLLAEFRAQRSESMKILDTYSSDEDTLSSLGRHPDIGEVTLSQLLATWVVHDLDHIGQIVRVMAKQYSEEVGPWKQFMRVLNT